jgi:hypothetical protein
MVRPLSRNPLLRSLVQNWWLPVLAAPALSIAWTTLSPTLAVLTAWLPVVYAAALVGIVGPVCLHAGVSALREELRHARRGHAFLCPHCLRFDELRFACGACGHEVEPLIVHTRGVYVNDCPDCGALIYSRDGESGKGVQALCRHCSRVCDREIYHERRVRVVGALRESDFTALCAAIGVQPARTLGGIDRGCHDDGDRLTFILSLAKLPGFAAMLPSAHALWTIEHLWLDGSESDPLELGEGVDRFLHRAGLSERQRQRMTLCVGGRVPENAARRLLAARFGRVAYRVAPAALIGAGASSVPAPPDAVGVMEKAG